MDDVLAETTSGTVRGRTVSGIHTFKGIPYGADMGGRNRFLPPQPAVPWPGVRDALEHGPSAIQPGRGEVDTGLFAPRSQRSD